MRDSGKRSTLRSGRSSSSSSAAAAAAAAGGGSPAAAVGTPPYLLGPIAEQKSMEEREELELKRQPPSPLQHFIDSIRHSATAHHAPIYYGTKDLLLDGLPGQPTTASVRHMPHPRTSIPTKIPSVPEHNQWRITIFRALGRDKLRA